MDLDTVASAMHVRDLTVEQLIAELREATGVATNSQLFARLETILGIQRTSMFRWVANGKYQRIPSRQTMAQLKLLLLLLKGEPDYHLLDGEPIKRR